MKNSLLVLAFVLSSASAFAQAPSASPTVSKKEQNKAARQAESDKVKTACSEEIVKTGCKEELGKGLLKCIHEYRKSNKDFKVSDSCKASVKDTREVRHERKSEKKNK